MGEAKRKEEARRRHAAKIVAAFEQWIEAIVRDMGSDYISDAVRRDRLRDVLLTVLVTPPPHV